MTLPIQTFDNIVDNQAAAMKANSPVILDFENGSVIKALIEANAANSIWLQALATSLQAVTRLSTSSGNDVDTFIADFGFSRQQGTNAFGNITFSRFTSTVQGVVPVGTIVSDSTNNLTFIVTLNTELGSYDPVLNAYVAPINTATLQVPCVCQTVGLIGNVIIGAIDTINAPNTTPGFDSVTNESALTGGTDQWSDTVTKQEFLLYINSLSRATLQAIQFAVSTINIGTEHVARYNIVENVNESGSPQLGYFYVVIDNGTGNVCSDDLVDAVSANVELYRGLTIQYNVDKAGFIAITISVSVNLISNPTESNATITANIKAALTAYSLSIPFNQPFLYNMIGQVVLASDPNILNIPSTLGNNPTLNSSNSDIAGNNLNVFGIPTINVVIL